MIWTSAFMRPGLYLIHSSFQGLTWKSRMFTIVHFPWSLLTTDFAPASKDVLSFSVSEPPLYLVTTGFSGGASGKEPACQCRRHKRHGFNPRVGKIPWKGKWQPTPVLLSGESHGQRSLAGYSPWGRKELDRTEATEHMQRFNTSVTLATF